MARPQTHNPPRSLAINLSTQGTGIDKYPAKSHARRVAEKLEVVKGLLVLAATPSAIYPNSDQPVPFRQDRYFYYLSGCNEPGCYVTYDIGLDRLVLWLPEIDKRRVVWSGRGSTVEEALERYDVDEANYITSSLHGVGALNEVDTVAEADRWPAGEKGGLECTWQSRAFLGKHLQDRISDFDLYADNDEGLYAIDVSIFDEIYPGTSSFANGNETKLMYALDACRVIKDEHEIALIRKANEITAAAHRAVLHSLHGLTGEAEVEAEYMRVCIARHAKEQAYSPIAGSGSNASVLHYVKNDEDFGDRQMMVLDAGCEVSCYASDVTRTVPLNKRKPGTWPSKEAENVYKLVERVQEACIAEMRPGKSFMEIVRLSQDMTLDGLLQLGVLKGDREVIRKARTHLAFFPHGLGHHLGLEVHDVAPQAPPPKAEAEATCSRPKSGCVKAVDCTPWLVSFPLHDTSASTTEASKDHTKLQPGMVVTIEPGVYFNTFLLDNFFLNDPKHAKFINAETLKKYMPVGGVRIEDDILIMKTGYENLTSAPKGEAMLECIRKGAEASKRIR